MQSLAISKDTVKNAKTYLPLATKSEIAAEIAQKCITLIEATMTVGNVPVEVPDYSGTNTALKARYLLGALYKFYLGIPFEPVAGTDFLLSADDYDRAGASHPLNALERLKADKDAKDKCFDLLRDYKELCEMCKNALADNLAARNNPVLHYLAAQAMAFTPEAMQALSNAEKELRKDIAKLRRTGAQAQEAIREHGEGNAAALAAIPVDPEAYAKAAEARVSRYAGNDEGTGERILRSAQNDGEGREGRILRSAQNDNGGRADVGIGPYGKRDDVGIGFYDTRKDKGDKAAGGV